MPMKPRRAVLFAFFLLPLAPAAGQGGAPTLQDHLAREGPADLARAARKEGDATRGAVLFHQPRLTCTRCHTAGEKGMALGPDLAGLGKDATDVHLVESLLAPSKVIRKGYETVTITTTAGKTLTGLLAEERADAVVLRDAAGDGKPVVIAKKDIEARHSRGPSLMPEGLVNQLADRREFLDLVRYLIEVAENGPTRARQLRPDPALFTPPPLPEYERDLDHAGLIRSLDDRSFRRGEVIYNHLCVNCHGTRDKPGSLPTSPRFAEARFKNGSDPYRMYQTLTHGFGLMTPQTWMVPRQKYDVIHYIREAYLKAHNPAQYVPVDGTYLSRLPRGIARGPKPNDVRPWASMDYGPTLMATYEVARGIFAYKSIAVRLDAGPGGVSRGRRWVVYDHDTMGVQGAWSGEGFIDYNGINFNGKHQVHPRVAGLVAFANPAGPGWAHPETGRFDDPRPKGRDGRPFGPLPRTWAHYKGLYHFGAQAILSYTVGKATILEMPTAEFTGPDKDSQAQVVFARTLNIGPSPHSLRMRIAPQTTAVALVGGGKASLVERDGFTVLEVPAAATPLKVKVLMTDADPDLLRAHARTSPPPMALEAFTKGGRPRWPEVLTTRAVRGADTRAFAVDVLSHPAHNPWLAQMRLTGLDFLPGGRAAVCTWDGDVWLVGGLDSRSGEITWQRIASGLFQPLGLKVLHGRIHVCCRDQICILHDLNGDGETDFYENFNNDHQVTEHFHEFAMGLQADASGNLYYAKAARHALPALVPHHGTLLRVHKDGSRTDILATGFRAPNGVCLNADGTFFLTDQEGHWTPKNRINWVKAGGFYGNAWGYHDRTDTSDAAMQPPVCWITNQFDRSPAELVRVESKSWGPLHGALLNLSYGHGKVYIVLHEKVGDTMQGGMCPLPLPLFPTGVMRGRFRPSDGHLYACGMFAWAGNQQQPGGLYRVRATGKPAYLPVALRATKAGLAITFSAALAGKTATDPRAYAVKTWSLKRSAKYGSDHHDEKALAVKAARLSEDGKTVTLEIADLRPTWCMEVRYWLEAADGQNVEGVIHNTIHRLGDDRRP